MLKQCLLRLEQTVPRSLPKSYLVAPNSVFCRHASNRQSKKPIEPSRSSRRYIEVDSPLAKANRYTYMKPEDPYGASDKVSRILKMGTIEDAADYVKALPIYLQSTIVWNQLINHCAFHGRANYAEQYYSQMRKRGFEPNSHTFAHMLSAYAKSDSPQAVESAEAWMQRIEDFDMTPTILHMNSLMKVYNNNNQPEKTLSQLQRISVDTVMIPDAITYSLALKACCLLEPKFQMISIRRVWQDVMQRVGRKNQPQPPTSLLAKKAQKIAAAHGPTVATSALDIDLKVDDSLVIALLNAVAQANQNSYYERQDISVAVEAIDRLYSLCPERAANLMKGVQRTPGFGFQPSVKVLDAILRFAGKTRQYKLGKDYYRLALNQYPRLKPDMKCRDAMDWIYDRLKHVHKKNPLVRQ
ncbi:hypothetical protein A0J61_07607 [Choanephora cucurbitarum]|uniref:Uncharacterized protein n=1 Tax=Choanephora cucurbitarum TaxID=101091 RepID=A0A1C7NAF4_9FUNG|nr:hypothetical protein A0J61_07607 [Choanephora cucurbitarum]